MFIEVRCIEPTHLIFLTSTGQDKPWHDFKQNQMSWPHYFHNLSTRCLSSNLHLIQNGTLCSLRRKIKDCQKDLPHQKEQLNLLPTKILLNSQEKRVKVLILILPKIHQLICPIVLHQKLKFQKNHRLQ